MYLHLGNGFVVDKKSIVGVFDMDNATVSRNGKKIFNKAQDEGRVIDTSDDLPKSFILTDENGYYTVYISSISSQTLLKRSQISSLSDEF